MFIRSKFLVLVLLAIFNLATLSNVYADTLFAGLHGVQYKRLTAPSNYQTRKESEGKVYLYIGMKDKEVEKVLDSDFDRIENFLFMSVIVTDKTGSPSRNKQGQIILESDDC